MNEAFNAVVDVGTNNKGTNEGKRLSYYNLIDVGVITGVSEGRCSVQSYRIIGGREVIYEDLELVYPGGVGSTSPEGMSCIVLFPPEVTDLKEKTISTLKPYFSTFGGKVIPVNIDGECDVLVGSQFDGTYSMQSECVALTIAKNCFSLILTNGQDGQNKLVRLSIKADNSSLKITMLNDTVLFSVDNTTNTIIKTQLNNGTPFVHEVDTPTERWIGYVGYKAMSHNDIKYDVTKYVKTDFNFVEDYLATERWIYIYKNDGSVLASLCIDNTGEIYVSTEEKITVEAKKDVTVDRDGTKLEVKNGKVVVTGDLEVSGKATITGMSTDLRNFLSVLMSGLTPMYTLGSPATHQPDSNYKTKMTQAQGFL